MKIQLPDKVQTIIETLTAAGYEAYAVGGCIRDCVLGRLPNDWDITTSATPEGDEAPFCEDFRYRHQTWYGDGPAGEGRLRGDHLPH